MPTLHGEMPYDAGPQAPCIWCGAPTDITFIPAGMPHLGPQPMHMLCATGLLRAYQRWLAGGVLPERDRQRLAKLTRPALPG